MRIDYKTIHYLLNGEEELTNFTVCWFSYKENPPDRSSMHGEQHGGWCFDIIVKDKTTGCFGYGFGNMSELDSKLVPRLLFGDFIDLRSINYSYERVLSFDVGDGSTVLVEEGKKCHMPVVRKTGFFEPFNLFE